MTAYRCATVTAALATVLGCSRGESARASAIGTGGAEQSASTASTVRAATPPSNACGWLTVTEVARLGNRARPTRLTMESALEQGSRTQLRFLAIEDDAKLDDRMFTPSALERGE